MEYRILVVDDDAAICLAFKRVLEMRLPFPCQVDTALSGAEALAKAFATPLHLVVLDIRMPGMSGLEVRRALKADPRTAQCRVVYISGENTPPALQADEAFLAKPVSMTVLCETVLQMLQR